MAIDQNRLWTSRSVRRIRRQRFAMHQGQDSLTTRGKGAGGLNGPEEILIAQALYNKRAGFDPGRPDREPGAGPAEAADRVLCDEGQRDHV